MHFSYTPHLNQGEEECKFRTFWEEEKVWCKGTELACKSMCVFELPTHLCVHICQMKLLI